MATGDREILELLRDELAFIEKGGYSRSVRAPRQRKSTFQDPLSGIDYGYPHRAHPRNECLLNFVPENTGPKSVLSPIPLNTDGDTIEDWELQAKLEREAIEWLRARIKEIETGRPHPPDLKRKDVDVKTGNAQLAAC